MVGRNTENDERLKRYREAAKEARKAASESTQEETRTAFQRVAATWEKLIAKLSDS
jgi:hypothetical protein